jgi:hypothetical protein
MLVVAVLCIDHATQLNLDRQMQRKRLVRMSVNDRTWRKSTAEEKSEQKEKEKEE